MLLPQKKTRKLKRVKIDRIFYRTAEHYYYCQLSLLPLLVWEISTDQRWWCSTAGQ